MNIRDSRGTRSINAHVWAGRQALVFAVMQECVILFLQLSVALDYFSILTAHSTFGVCVRVCVCVCVCVFAVQTCTVTETQFNGLNYDKGTCTVADGKVVLNAVGAATTCNFACKEGYYHAKGDTKIAFTCASNGATNAKGTDNWGTMEKCKRA